jgi:hypothetical protein
VHADRYFGRYRGKNGHTASTREPTRLTRMQPHAGPDAIFSRHRSSNRLPDPKPCTTESGKPIFSRFMPGGLELTSQHHFAATVGFRRRLNIGVEDFSNILQSSISVLRIRRDHERVVFRLGLLWPPFTHPIDPKVLVGF